MNARDLEVQKISGGDKITKSKCWWPGECGIKVGECVTNYQFELFDLYTEE
jgi:hypothetical protein